MVNQRSLMWKDGRGAIVATVYDDKTLVCAVGYEGAPYISFSSSLEVPCEAHHNNHAACAEHVHRATVRMVERIGLVYVSMIILREFGGELVSKR